MQTKTYWVGDRPAGSWTFQVLNQRTANPEVLTGFTSARVIMLDSENNEVEIPDENVSISNPAAGTVTFIWPQESLFTKPGRYVVQLELIGGTARRKTTVQEILVKQIGGVTN